jgi:hypothetical protein
MKRKKFHLSHSVLGAILLVGLEGFLLFLLGRVSSYADARGILILVVALFGGVANVVVATEVIEEVRNARHMLFILSAVVAEFVAFFAFQYWYLIEILPESFPALGNNPIDLLLHSTMVFVFNPLYLPANAVGRSLLLINTFAALALVLFILQNVWQLRAKDTTRS